MGGPQRLVGRRAEGLVTSPMEQGDSPTNWFRMFEA